MSKQDTLGLAFRNASRRLRPTTQCQAGKQSMKNLIFAALTALAVSACTTVESTPSSADLKADKASPQIHPTDAASVLTENSVKDGKQNDFSYAASDHTDETLLYGAMTKFELMSFVEIINAGDQQAVLEQNEVVTVFAPKNSAFEYAGRPKQADIAGFLRDHMIADRFDLQTLKTAISKNGGPVTLQTLSGQSMTVYFMDGKIKISGANGVLSTVTLSDMTHSNGVMHQISHVIVR